jgi:hypothetical protein
MLFLVDSYLGLDQSEHIKQMITLSVITIKGI